MVDLEFISSKARYQYEFRDCISKKLKRSLSKEILILINSIGFLTASYFCFCNPNACLSRRLLERTTQIKSEKID